MPNQRKYLEEHYPWVLEGWHPSRNDGVDTSTLFVSSEGNFWWLCQFGHSFPQRINKRILGSGCLVCKGFIVPGENDFFTLYPKMRLAFLAANSEEPPDDLPSNQRTPKYDWECPRGHQYSANLRQVSHNLGSSGEPCEVCRKGDAAVGKNLSIGYEEHFEEWDWEHNKLGPEYFSWGSSTAELYWRCKNGHPPYKATPYQKRTRERMCPACSGSHRLVKGINDLASTHPRISERWDYEENASGPTEVKIGMNINVTLKCDRDPKHRPRMYLPNLKKNSEACTDCWANSLEPGVNDLQTVGSTFVNEWDSEKNMTNFSVRHPSNIKWTDERRFFWKCDAAGHSFQISPYYRVTRGSGCTVCSNKTVLAGFNDLAYLIPEIAEEWCHQKNEISPREVTPKSGRIVFWNCMNGHKPFPSSVWNRTQAETGCPGCSQFGYQNELPGMLYLVEREDVAFGRRARKIGITGAERSHIRLGLWRRQGFNVVETWTRADGGLIRNCEREVLLWLRNDLKLPQFLEDFEMPLGGETETFAPTGVSNLQLGQKINSILSSND